MRQNLLTAVLMTVVLTVLLGLVYPLVVTGLAQLAFNPQANGSLIKDKDGNVVGSELIGQQFTAPQYFHGRPSATVDASNAATPVPYNAANSSASNLGPTNPNLIGDPNDPNTTPGAARTNLQQVLDENQPYNPNLKPQDVPIDLITSSGSGLDPHISPQAARIQIPRVAQVRGVPEARVRQLVDKYTEGRQFFVLGEPRVNVLELNLALDAELGKR